MTYLRQSLPAIGSFVLLLLETALFGGVCALVGIGMAVVVAGWIGLAATPSPRATPPAAAAQVSLKTLEQP